MARGGVLQCAFLADMLPQFCQKRGWKLFHRDECGILKNSPDLSTKNLATHRLLLWQERGLLGNDLTRAILLLETHFREIVDGEDKDRATQLIVGGDGIRKATNSKMSTGAVWKLFGAMLTNSTFVRQAHHSEPFGTAFDLLTSMINHSCAPNAFVFLEGRALRVRALAPIRPGDEITICYLDPTIHVSKRMELLKKDHFFDCCCKCILYCNMATIQGPMLTEPKANAAKPRSRKRWTALAAISKRHAFGDEEWYPDHMDPMPMANMCLGQLYLRQKKLPIALRLILKSKLCSRRRNGPEFVNEMFEVMRVLVMVGDLPDDAPEYSNFVFPQKSEIRTIARGYVYEMYTAAGQVYGGDSILTGVVGEIYENLTKNMGWRPGSKEFRDEFVPAQQKLLAWAGIDVAHGLVLSD
ncbi:hypothetical protein GQ53DRAFT_739381 [Thozetella sp. PMI_491]|nr:hypothetical protein GQ53DRAFT_739381 [Thozetella sp. PMI_491]